MVNVTCMLDVGVQCLLLLKSSQRLQIGPAGVQARLRGSKLDRMQHSRGVAERRCWS